MGCETRWCLPCLLLLGFISAGYGSQPVPYVVFPGDVVIGVVLSVHQRQGDRCGPVTNRGIQATEVIVDAMREINGMRAILPNITIGVVIFDDCEIHEKAVSLVAQHFTGGSRDIFSRYWSCSSGERPMMSRSLYQLGKVIGVVSGARRWQNVKLAMVSGLFKLPMVSYRSTPTRLPNSLGLLGAEPYFLHSSPRKGRPTAICQLFKRMGWTYVSVISVDNYNSWATQDQLEACFRANGICMASRLRMRNSADIRSREVERILDELLRMPNAKAVVVIDSTGGAARKLFEAAKRRNQGGRFRWFDASGWGTNEFADDSLRDVLTGTITVQPRSISAFKAELLSRKRQNDYRYAWFQEYRIANKTDVIDPDLVYIREAVFAYGFALDALRRELCPNAGSVCPAMDPESPDVRKRLFEKLKAVRYTQDAGKPFYFHDGYGRTDLLLKEFTNENGKYYWKEVGTFSEAAGTFPDGNLELERIFLQRLQSLSPSVCSLPCPPGHRKAQQAGDSCCWLCIKEN